VPVAQLDKGSKKVYILFELNIFALIFFVSLWLEII